MPWPGSLLEAGCGADDGGAADGVGLSEPMMLLITLSAACCAAAAGKYTLMVTQPASKASAKAIRNTGLRMLSLQWVCGGPRIAPEFTLAGVS